MKNKWVIARIWFCIVSIILCFFVNVGAKTYLPGCEGWAFSLHDMQGWDFFERGCSHPACYYKVKGFNVRTSPVIISFDIIPKNNRSLERLSNDNIAELKKNVKMITIETYIIRHKYKNISKICIFEYRHAERKQYVSYLDPGKEFNFCIMASMVGKKNITSKYEGYFMAVLSHCGNVTQK